jgi:hypothetical protein
LRDDDVRAGARGPHRFGDRSDLMEHDHSRGVRPIDVWRRVTPEERQDGDPLFHANRDEFLGREAQDQVDPERLARQRAHLPDGFTEHRRRSELRLKHAEATGVADRCHQLGTREIGPHRRRDDRRLDSQRLAELSSHESRP